jgi:NarL family two-component system response regulator LiaR
MSAQKPIRVVLVDDHPVVRAGIKVELEKSGVIAVVGEASTGKETLRQVTEQLPDLLLLDMALPDLDGVEVICRLRKTHPKLCILVFSGYADDAFVFGALEAGAAGYLLKDEMLDRLADAVQAAMEGEIVLSSRVTQKAVRQVMERGSAQRDAVPLTDREAEILKLVALFRTNEEIAARLSISIKTVEYHLANILVKLGKKSRREAARWAWDTALIALAPSSMPEQR